MYSRETNELPQGYSGSVFREEEKEVCPVCREDARETRETEKGGSKGLFPLLGRFRVGRLIKERVDPEDLLLLGLALLLLIEDGEDDLFPLLLLFLLIGQ